MRTRRTAVGVVVVAPPPRPLAMPFEFVRFRPSSLSTIKCPHGFLIGLDPRRIRMGESAIVSIVMLVESMIESTLEYRNSVVVVVVVLFLLCFRKDEDDLFLFSSRDAWLQSSREGTVIDRKRGAMAMVVAFVVVDPSRSRGFHSSPFPYREECPLDPSRPSHQNRIVRVSKTFGSQLRRMRAVHLHLLPSCCFGGHDSRFGGKSTMGILPPIRHQKMNRCCCWPRCREGHAAAAADGGCPPRFGGKGYCAGCHAKCRFHAKCYHGASLCFDGRGGECSGRCGLRSTPPEDRRQRMERHRCRR